MASTPQFDSRRDFVCTSKSNRSLSVGVSLLKRAGEGVVGVNLVFLFFSDDVYFFTQRCQLPPVRLCAVLTASSIDHSDTHKTFAEAYT